MLKTGITEIVLGLAGIMAFFLVLANIPEFEVVKPITDRVSESNIEKTITHLSSYKNRRYDSETGVASMKWIASEVSKCAAGRNDVTVKLFEHDRSKHKNWIQPSVIAHLEGTKSPEKTVIIGSHGDTVNLKHFYKGPEDDISPGADDSASSVAVNLEAFCILLKSGIKPNKSIEFITFAAEEFGLLGSKEIARVYKEQNKQIVAALQIDMTLWSSSDGSIVFITDHVNEKLTKETQQLARELGYTVSNDECGYKCSDHSSWTDNGFPSVFPFEAYTNQDNPYIHSSDDTIDNAGGTAEAIKFAKLAVAFLMHYSN